MSGKSRPVLRASQTHNGALTPISATTTWSRRDESQNGQNGHNSHNGQSRLAPLGQNQQHQQQQQQQQAHGSVGLSATYPNTPLSTTHEASAPFSHSGGPIATAYSAGSVPPPPSSSHHHSSSHTTQAMSINNSNNGTPYSEDFSFQSSAYPSSYDSSYGSNSPWAPQSGLEHGHHYHQHQHPYYAQMMSSKIEEPILGPGEVPAPRPPMSYAALIGEALLTAPPPHQLYVSEISDSIKRRYSCEYFLSITTTHNVTRPSLFPAHTNTPSILLATTVTILPLVSSADRGTDYRQNPTKVYNGVRHQTSMCKAFVKLPRPFGDQSGGARKWAIRSGCETWFQGGGYHPPGSNAAANLKHKSTSPPLGNNGKAKQTARSKQLAIGTSVSSPKILHSKAVKSEPYNPSLGGGGPSVGPAFDGTGKPYYPAFSHAHAHAHAPPPPASYQHQPYGTQQPSNGYYAYHPIQHAPSWQHGHSGQVNGTSAGAGGMQPTWQQLYSNLHPPVPGSPSSQYDTSPQVSAAGPGQHPYSTYSSYAYAQPGSGPGPGSTQAQSQAQGQGQQHPYATQQQQEYKPYAGMGPPHLSHQHHSSIFPQSDERPHTQGSPTSQGSYEAKLSPNTSERHQSAELSPRH